MSALNALSASKLPIQDILNSNLVWARDDPGCDLGSLVASIKKIGLVTPVLLTRDLQVIDGVRRMLACRQLGHTDIPVIITNDWDVIKEYLITMRGLEEAKTLPFEPMPWLGNLHIGRKILRPLYWPVRGKLAGEVRKRNKELGIRSPRHSDQYAIAISEMLGLDRGPNHWKTLNDMGAALEKVEPQLVQGLRAKVRDIELNSGQIYTAWRLVRNTVRNPAVDIIPPHNVKAAQEQLGRLSRVNEILSHLATDIKSVGPVNPAMAFEDVTRISQQMKAQLRRLTTYQRRLLDGYSSGEKEEEV